MILYCPHITNRVHYMAGWLGNYLFGKPFFVTDDKASLPNDDIILNYSKDLLLVNSYQVEPCGLLFENSFRLQPIAVSGNEEFPFFFATGGKAAFDVLAATFFLLTRYEEYLPHQKDEYGRYWHKESIAFKNGFLHRPLVDEWMHHLKEQLQAAFPRIQFIQRQFSYTPTYDVDIAWCYLNKSRARTIGGFLKDTVQGNWQLCTERLQVLAGKKPDPFAVFEELEVLHDRYALAPIYFLLLSKKPRGYDKNILPTNQHYQTLIRRLSSLYKTGIHLSWQSEGSHSIKKEEIDLLEGLNGDTVIANRMHYINFHLPATFDTLISLGIKQEYSMGYGTINGFRASTCTPYKWYNLATETETDLEIVPYCYMDANSIFEQKDSPEKALEELMQFYNIVKKHQGQLVTIFHNHLVGMHPGGREWMGVLKRFLQERF